MFDRQAALNRIQDPGWRARVGYDIQLNNLVVNVKVVDRDNDIYRITMSRQMINGDVVLMVEEMTANQAVDRFEEFLCQVELADALFGWIGAT